MIPCLAVLRLVRTTRLTCPEFLLLPRIETTSGAGLQDKKRKLNYGLAGYMDAPLNVKLKSAADIHNANIGLVEQDAGCPSLESVKVSEPFVGYPMSDDYYD